MKFACLGYLIGMYTVIYQLRSKVQYSESQNLQYVEISPQKKNNYQNIKLVKKGSFQQVIDKNPGMSIWRQE